MAARSSTPPPSWPTPAIRPGGSPATTSSVCAYFAGQAEQGHADDPQRLADQLVIIFDGAIVQAVMGTGRRADAALTAASALLDAQHLD